MSPQAILFFVAIIAVGGALLKQKDRPNATGNMTAFDRRTQRPNGNAVESTASVGDTTGEEGTRFSAGRPPSIG